MRLVMVLLLGVALLGLAGCVMAYAPVSAGIVANEKGPYPTVIDNSVGWDKEGVATAEGILIVGFGDASIKAAAAQGQIKKIHHVDTEVLSVLGVYARYRTIVYGE